MDSVNQGFGSAEEARQYHLRRFVPKQTNLPYQFGARTPDQLVREPLPPSPLDGQQFQQALQVPQSGPMIAPPNMDVFGMAREQKRGMATPAPARKKSLEEIAAERGHLQKGG